MKGRTNMPANTTLDTTVSFYRTTLDPYDLYRIDDIINGGAPADTTTPAAALATYLREINPALRWHTIGGQSVVEQANSEVLGGIGFTWLRNDDQLSPLFLLDAAVFDNGEDEPTILANLRYDHTMRPYEFERVLQIQPLRADPACAVYATTLPVTPRGGVMFDSSHRRVKTTRNGEDAAHWISTRDEPVTSMRVTLHDSLVNMHARDTAPHVPEGFRAVAWDSDTWKVQQRPQVGQDIFDSLSSEDIADDDCPAVCAAILQGRGFVPLVEVEKY